ncbi:MAG: hypothetical protein H0U75_06890 [Legionella sp.]|nr:hypothetical protein [Legionella sp.]
MPYNTHIQNPFDVDQASERWELFISCNYHDLGEYEYELLKTQLIHIVNQYDVGLAMWEFLRQNDQDTNLMNFDFDARYAQDRNLYVYGDQTLEGNTRRGKDICLKFPDKIHCTWTGNQYKQMLLEIWRTLDENNCPIVYMNTLGVESIPGPGKLLTPFSIASDSPHHYFIGEAHLHGLSNQLITLNNRHPLAQVIITKQDLTKYRINYDAAETLEQSCQNFNKSRQSALENLNHFISEFANISYNYEDLLEETNFKLISKRLLEIVAMVKQDGLSEHEKITQFNELFKQLATFFARYPLQKTGNKYENNPILSKLCDISALREEQVGQEQLIEHLIQLKEAFANKTDQIKALYDQHNSAGVHSTEAHLIPWKEYIEGYTPGYLKTLIAKHPSGMQEIYNHILLLEKEKKAQQKIEAQYAQYSSYYLNTLSTDKGTVAVISANVFEEPKSGAINVNLITALNNTGISDIFLISNRSFTRPVILQLLALKEILETKGIRVVNVITQPDFAWNNSLEQLVEVEKQIHTLKEDTLSTPSATAEQQKSIKLDNLHFSYSEIGHAFREAETVYTNDYLQFKASSKFEEIKKHSLPISPALSYYIKSTKESDLSDKTALIKKSISCGVITEFYSKMIEDFSHVNGFLMHSLIRHQSNLSSYICFNDIHSSDAINECKQRWLGQKVITIHLSDFNSLEDYFGSIESHQSQVSSVEEITALENTFNSFFDKYRCTQNSKFVQYAQILFNDLTTDIQQQTSNGISHDKIINSPAMKIVDKTTQMLQEVDRLISDPNLDYYQKEKHLKVIMHQYQQCTQASGCKKFAKIVAIFAATALGLFLGALVGAGLGVAAGAWTGLGAAFTGVAGLVEGATVGASIGLVAASALTGGAAAITTHGLFKKSPFIKQMERDVFNIVTNTRGLVPATINTFTV